MESEFKINKRDVGKTLKQWLRKGYIPKRGRKGELRYESKASFRKGEDPKIYFDPSDMVINYGVARKKLAEILQKEDPWCNYVGRTLKQWLDAGYIPKLGCEGHLRYSSRTTPDDEKYLYFDPEEVRKGTLDDSSHARKVWQKEVNRRWNTTGKTLQQWAELGFVPKRNAKPTKRYINYYAFKHDGDVRCYYDESQVREDKEKASELMNAVKENKRQKAKEARARKQEEIKKVRQEWDNRINGGKVIMFGVYTTDFEANDNGLLSISWIVTDANLKLIKSVTRYFDWPNDGSNDYSEAERFYGFTKDRIAELGVCDCQAAIKEFMADLEGVTMMIAHDMNFERDFIEPAALRFRMDTEAIKSPWHFSIKYDTIDLFTKIVRGKPICRIPDLSEVAKKLRVKTDGLSWNSIPDYNEMLRRVVIEIKKKGIVAP